jgi:hypothetical protein
MLETAPRHALLTRQRLILALLLIGAAVFAGVAFWMNPLVEYYGEWMWMSDLQTRRETQPKAGSHCAQQPLTEFYRALAAAFPAPSIFICFDTTAEADAWVRANYYP